MADFLLAFNKTMGHEGGFKRHTVEGDTGGQTYAGIARNMQPKWPGWSFLDQDVDPPVAMVQEFYRYGWWDPLQGNAILNQRVAESLFDFAVNTSGFGAPITAVKIVQSVLGAVPDGVLGPKTLAVLNATDPEVFLTKFTLGKITHYRNIVLKNKSQEKFLLGWINRALQTT